MPDGSSERCHSQRWLAALLGPLLTSPLLCLRPARAKTSPSRSSLRSGSTQEGHSEAAGAQKRGELRPAFTWLQRRTTLGSKA